jgi:hypothetical protein
MSSRTRVNHKIKSSPRKSSKKSRKSLKSPRKSSKKSEKRSRKPLNSARKSTKRSRKPLNSARKSTKRSRKPLNSDRKSTKRSKQLKKSSYRFGTKVSDGVNIFDARYWQEEALLNFFRYRRNLSESGIELERDVRIEVKKGNETYVVFFNQDENGLYYHPSKQVQEIKQVPDKSRRTIVVSYDYTTLGKNR